MKIFEYIMQFFQQFESLDINSQDSTAGILLVLIISTLINFIAQTFKASGSVIKAIANVKKKKIALMSDKLDNELKQVELELKAEELKLKQEALKQEQEKTKQLKLANKKERAEQKRANELHKLDVAAKEVELQIKRATINND